MKNATQKTAIFVAILFLFAGLMAGCVTKTQVKKETPLPAPEPVAAKIIPIITDVKVEADDTSVIVRIVGNTQLEYTESKTAEFVRIVFSGTGIRDDLIVAGFAENPVVSSVIPTSSGADAKVEIVLKTDDAERVITREGEDIRITFAVPVPVLEPKPEPEEPSLEDVEKVAAEAVDTAVEKADDELKALEDKTKALEELGAAEKIKAETEKQAAEARAAKIKALTERMEAAKKVIEAAGATRNEAVKITTDALKPAAAKAADTKVIRRKAAKKKKKAAEALEELFITTPSKF